MTNYFMAWLDVDRQTAQGYVETKQGMEIAVASLTPVLGAAAAKQLSKIVDANLKVVARGNVDGARFTDTNQGARPSYQADVNKPTLINDIIQAKIDKRPDKSLPNGKDMLMSVSGERVCSYCSTDIVKMADKSGLKSLTIYEERSGDVLYWEAGMKKFIRK